MKLKVQIDRENNMTDLNKNDGKNPDYTADSRISSRLNNNRSRFRLGSRGIRVILACLLVALQMMSLIAVPGIAIKEVKAGDNDVTLEIEVPEVVQKGERFQVTAKVTNNSGADIDDLILCIVPYDSLVPAGSDWNIPVKGTIKKNSTYPINVNMSYNGADDSFKLGMYCKYNNDIGTTLTVQKFIIANTKPVDNTPTDTTKYKPDIKVKSGLQMPVVNAGDDVSLTLPIVNAGATEAKDIIVSIDTSDVSSLPFTFNQVNLSSTLKSLVSNKEESVVFNIGVKSDIAGGIYPVKLNYQYQNPYRDSFSSSETIYIKVVNNKVPPKIILERFQTYSNNGEYPKPGSIASLTLKFKNQGSISAKDVKVSIKGLSNDGISVVKSADTKYISEIEGQKTQDVDYFLYISDKFKGNNATLQANVEYKDSMGKTYSEEYQFFVMVQETKEDIDDSKPELILKDLVFPKEKVEAGKDFNIGFTLDNMGDDTAHNVKVTLSCEDGILPISAGTVVVDALNKGESKNLSFNLYANKTAITKNYLVTINVEYEDKKDDKSDSAGSKTEKYTLTRYAGVYVEKKEDEKDKDVKTVPKIIISMYTFEPEEVKAGENFKLKLSFLNTSKIVPIRNVKVTFSAKEGVFIPTSSSNTFFIENMGIQEAVARDVELFTKSDAPAKSHILNLNFEYEDGNGNQYTAAEEISIPVKQEQRLSMGQLQMPPDTMEGQPIPIFMDFFNMGKSTLFNLMVSIEGEGLKSENANYFVGNFEPGRSDYFESMVTPTATGEIAGNVLFSYEDESGKKNEIRKEIKLNVRAMEMPPMPSENGEPGKEFPGEMMPEGPQQKKLLTPLNIGIAAGALIIIVIILIIILRKRRIRKAGMMFDE
ncbi:MAG TPA: CARDB domain-containing protein [Clostridiales bacterium]|nr:CARDB domain-containing protein [Clostridiales bacterium]